MDRIFVCYHSDPENFPSHRAFAHRVSYFLRLQEELDVFCYDQQPTRAADEIWQTYVRPYLVNSRHFLLFVGAGDELGPGQVQELDSFIGPPGRESTARRLAVVYLAEPSARLSREVEQYVHRMRADCAKVLRYPIAPRGADALKQAQACALDVFLLCRPEQRRSGGDLWYDGLPVGYPFDYEKDIIDQYLTSRDIVEALARQDCRNPRFLIDGCPLTWPELARPASIYRTCLLPDDVGSHRRHEDVIIVDPRATLPVAGQPEGGAGRYHQEANGTCLWKRHLTFLEAGPRGALALPDPEQRPTGGDARPLLHVGIVVSGGIAPGINAVIEGIFERHRQYWEAVETHEPPVQHGSRPGKASSPDRDAVTPPPGRPSDLPFPPRYRLRVSLFHGGFPGLFQDPQDPPDPAQAQVMEFPGRDGSAPHLPSISQDGGSHSATARQDDLLPDAPKRAERLMELAKRLRHPLDLDVLYVIGGEGSIRCAQALQELARQDKVAVVAIPKTMDNDILWVWQSFGFLSAVERAREFIGQLGTEVRSNPRLCVIQLFGSDSGFVVSHAALGAGRGCQAALIPELRFSLRRLGEYICGRLDRHGATEKHGIVVLAETAIPVDVEDFLDCSELNLEQAERDAVRDFTGSALLTSTDIAPEARSRFLRCLMHGDMNEDPRIGDLRQRFRKVRPRGWHVAGILQEDNVRLAKDDALWSCFLLEMNGFLRNQQIRNAVQRSTRRFAGEPLEIIGQALCNAIQSVQRVLRSSDGNDQAEYGRLVDRLQRLRLSTGLPSEAVCVIRQIESDRDAQQGRGTGADHGAKGTILPAAGRQYLLRQLERRLTEVFNRAVLETCFPGCVAHRQPAIQKERRVVGQTPDKLRTAGLKVVARFLEQSIRDSEFGKQWAAVFRPYQVFTNEPRHLIRAMAPSCHDVIFGHRLGKLAVDNAMAGYKGFMISQWLTEYVLVPLELVTLGRKRVPTGGIFWKSVVASTGQPPNLWWPEDPPHMG